MSLNFSTDTSTQLTYSSFGFATPQFDNFTTSNQLLITSNQIINKVNTDITAINTNLTNNYYNKTTTDGLLNAKEQNLTFSSPLTRTTNTVSINLSSYSVTGADTNYVLKSGSTMTGAIVNTSTTASEFKGIYIMHAARQTHIPYLPDGKIYFRAPLIIDHPDDYISMGSKIADHIIRLYGGDFSLGVNSGTLRYNVPMGSVHRFYHGTTNTVWINDVGRLKATTFEGSGSALTDVPYTALTGTAPFYTKTETNTLITNTSNYALNVSNVIITNANNTYLKLAGGTMAANANITLSGTGTFTGIHSGNGAALTNLPLSAYSTTGNDSSYVLKTGSTMTGLLSGTTINTTGNIGIGITNPPAPLSIGTPDVLGSDGFIFIGKYKANVGNRCFKIGYDDGFNMCFGDFGPTIGSTSWTPTQFNINWNSGNVGIGTSGQTQKLNVNGTTYFNGNSTVIGTLTATTFSGSGASLTNLPLSAYSTTGNDGSYLLKTGGVMSGQITGVSTLNATTGIFGSISTTNTTNLNTPQLGAFGGVGDRFILYVGTASVHPYSLGMNSSVLWYSVPAGTSHIFYVGGSPITTISSTGLSTTGLINASTNLQEAGTNLTSKYAQLATANTLTGNLTVNADLILKNSVWHRSIDGVYRFYYGLNDVSYYCCGGALAEGHIFMDSAYNHRFKIKNNGNIEVSTGNVGIGTATIDERIHIHTSGTNNAFIKINAGGGTGQSGLRLFAGNGTTNRATRIDFFNNVASTTSARWTLISDGDQNATNDFRIYNAGGIANILTLLQSGNIGIGTLTPQTKLEVFEATNPKIFLNQNGTTRCFVSATSLGLDLGNDVGTSKIIRFMPDNVEKMRISNDGNVNIVNTLQIASVDINNWLFNNSGRNHGVYQDFNTIDKFGYSFIQNSTNGPGVDTQYYSWYIGLGNEYPFANSVNGYYGMQFAIGRNNTYPRLSIRRKENNAWTGWQGITAEQAVSLTSGDKTISGTLTATGRTYCNGGLNIQVNSWVYDGNGAQRIYFGSGAKTYYQGYGQYTTDVNHEWWNHSSTPIMKLSNTGSLLLEGEIVPLMASVANAGTDYCGVTLNSSQGTNYKTSIKIMFGTFTGFHRCFTDDIEYKEEEPQKFKDDYVGRIVISTGKIATDTKSNDEEWEIKYDKEGITIEDALPIIQLSRTKKDKRVFGVLGMPSRNNSRNERMIVNSVGEGSIWICNSNGNIENGDYITSSDYLGYGEKQEEIFLANYTVAKATMDCNFELNNPLYQCQELEEGLRVAFIACTYHSG